jgi:nicotinamide riboside kinase
VCHEHAEWCADQARGALRNEDRQEYLLLMQRWLKLARGYEAAASRRRPSTVADE